MSLLDQALHDSNEHGSCMLYSTPTGVVCLRCLFEALSSDTMLVSRRMYLLRRFAELEVPGAADTQTALLGDACSQYPDYLLDHLMAALAVARDADLSAALQELCLHMASLTGFFREALMDRLAAAVADLQAWADGKNPGASTRSSCLPPAGAYLQLLGSLCASFTSAEGPCGRLVAALSNGEPLLEALLQGARAADPELRCATLRLLASVLAAGAGQLPPPVQGALFVQLGETLSILSAAEEQQLCLASLQQLVMQGGAAVLEQLPGAPNSLSPTGSSLMQGLRRALLAGDLPTQLAGVQLAGAVSSSAAASPQLLGSMLQSDLCEHLVEVVRVTLQEQQQLVQQHRQQQVPGLGYPLSQPSQQQGSPWAGSQAAAGVAARCDMCETIQLATVSALRHLSTQGEEFLLHLQFGLETIAHLIAAAASSSHHQLLAAALSLINDTRAASNWLGMLPAGALQQLTKAIAACLLEQVEGQAAALGELQPSENLAAVHVMACRLLTWICQCAAAAPSLWTSLKGPLHQAALRAAAALQFDTPTLLQGYLAAACGLLQQVTASLLLDAAGAIPQTQFMQQQQQLQQQGSQAPRNALAARLQRPSLLQDAASNNSAGMGCAEELLLALLNCTANHVLPAMCRVMDSTRQTPAAAAAGGLDLSQECYVGEALAPALRCLITMLQSGHHCAALQGPAAALADLLLGQHAWVGASLHLLHSAGQLEGPVARSAAWELLLLLLGTADELGLLAGVQTTPEQLAGQLDKLVPCPSHLLEALLPHQRQQQQQQQQAPASRGRTQAPGARSNSISAYCGLSDAQLAVLALLAASVRGSCCMWPVQQVLMTLNLLVAQHASALQRQPGLLSSIVQLYAIIEQQAARAQAETAAVQGGQLQLGDPELSDILQSAPQHIMTAMLQAPGFHSPPATLVSQWVLSKGACAPAVALKLLQAWVGDLQAAAAGGTPATASQEQQQRQGASQGSSEQVAAPGGIAPEALSAVQQLYQDILLVVGRVPGVSELLLEACTAAQGPLQQQLWLLVLAGLLRHSPEAAASMLQAGDAAGFDSTGGSSSRSSSAGGWLALTRRVLLSSLSSLQQSPLAVCGALCCAWVLQGLVAAAAGADGWRLDMNSVIQQAQMLVTAANRLPQAGAPCQQQLQLAALDLINCLSMPQPGGVQQQQLLQHLYSQECAGLARSLAAAACQQPHATRSRVVTSCGDDSSSLCVVEALLVACQALQPEGGGRQPLEQQLAPAPSELLLAAALRWHYSCMKLLLRGRLQAAAPEGLAASLLPLVSPLCSWCVQQLEQQQQEGELEDQGARQQQQEKEGAAEEAPAVFGLSIAEVLVLVEACRSSSVAPLLLRSLWVVLLLLQALAHSHAVGATAAIGPTGVAATAAAAAVKPDTLQLSLCLLPSMAAGAGGDAAGAQLAPWADCCLAALVQLASAQGGCVLLGEAGRRLVLRSHWGGRWACGTVQRLCSGLGELQLCVEGQGGDVTAEEAAAAGRACAQVCLAGCSVLAAGLSQLEGTRGGSSGVAGATWLARPGAGQAVREEAARALQQQGLLRLLVWAVGWGVAGMGQQQMPWRQAGVGAVAAQLLLELWQGGLLQPHLQLLAAAVEGWPHAQQLELEGDAAASCTVVLESQPMAHHVVSQPFGCNDEEGPELLQHVLGGHHLAVVGSAAVGQLLRLMGGAV